MHPEKIVTANGVPLCVQEFGAPADPGLLLIGGAASSMDWWEDDFCERLAAGGRRVVRYDLRDTGRSVSSPAGKPDYDGADLTDDAVALLDLLGLEHVVGLSMGGGIAQDIAIRRRANVATITVMSTSPVGPSDEELPKPEPRVAALFADPAPEPDWSNREAAIDHVLAGLAAFAGGRGVDEPRARAVAGRMYDRTTDFAASQTNHWILAGGEPVEGVITTPTLVVHGEDDPLFPIAHAEATRRRIPGATLLRLPGVGHEFPPEPVWNTVIAAIIRHTGLVRSTRG